MPFNADHITRAADDPYHYVYIQLIHHIYDIKRHLLKALTKAVCVLSRKIEALTMLGRQRLFQMLFIRWVSNCIGWIWIKICWMQICRCTRLGRGMSRLLRSRVPIPSSWWTPTFFKLLTIRPLFPLPAALPQRDWIRFWFRCFIPFPFWNFSLFRN